MNRKQVVKKSNSLVESRCNLTLNQQKLVLAIVAQIKREDEDFKEYFITVKNFKELMGLDSAGHYTEMRQAAKDIKSKDLIIPRDGGRELFTNWFSSIEIGHEGEVGFMFDFKLKPYLLQLQSHFTAYQLKNILSLKSKYSIRAYELLKQYESLGCRRFDLEDLRALLFVEPGVYPNFNNFKKRVLEPAEKDINEYTDISITYTTIKTGRKVTGIEFCIIAQGPGKVKIKPVPSKLMEMIPAPDRAACMDIAHEIFNRDGEAGLIFYLKKCNARKKTANGNYSGYMKTIFDMELYADVKEAVEAQVEAEKARVEAEAKAQTEQRVRMDVEAQEKDRLEDLLQSTDLEALDAFIQSQAMTGLEKGRFKKNKRYALRIKHINAFIQTA